MRAALMILALVCLAPGALAMDVFPAVEGAQELRVIARLPRGGTLVVEGQGVEVGLAEPGGAPAAWTSVPARFAVEARPVEESWHGLSGTVEVVARRADARAPATLRLGEAGGSAWHEIEWPPARSETPWPPAWWALPLAAALSRAAGARGSGGGGA